MTTIDYLLIAYNNIRQNKLRSILTIVGVAVAIGALFSMLSFGIGLQTNILDSLKGNQQLRHLTLILDQGSNKKTTLLSDSALKEIVKMDYVVVVFNEKTVPVRLQIGNESKSGFLRALPFGFSAFFEPSQFIAGNYFSNDSCFEIILNKKPLIDLLRKTDTLATNTQIDSIGKALIGTQIAVTTVTYDKRSASSIFSIMGMLSSGKLPVRDSILSFQLVGLVETQDPLDRLNQLGFISLGSINKIPSLGFENVMSLLDERQSEKTDIVNVYVDEVAHLSHVEKQLEKKGYTARSVLDNFKEIKKVFAIINSVLGAIGIMALFIATLGLVNTLVMSIYERTREIGIMKSLGAKEKEIKAVFVIEAGIVGFLGALFGIPFGWLITRLADIVFVNRILEEAGEELTLFSFPFYLIAGATAFSILFSMLAGFYPAKRAAAIDPVKALRHD